MSVSTLTGFRKVFIGNDLLEFSPALVRFDIGQIKRDRTGLALYDGEIELALVNGLPESINPRLNPQRWARGNQVLVQERKSNGTYVNHPMGALIILNAPPALDLVEPRLILEVGCVLSYRLSQTASSILKAGSPTTSTPRTEVIGSLLANALISDWVGEIDEFPFAGNIAIDGEMNPVEAAGLIAWSAGYRLFQNADREIEAISDAVDADQSPALVFSTVPDPAADTEAVLYEPASGEEVVLEEFTVKSSDNGDKPPISNYDTQRSVFEEFGDAKAIDTAASGPVLLKRTTIEDRQTPTEKTRVTTIEQAEGLILGNKKFSLRFAEEITETYLYEGTSDGKLLSIRRIAMQAWAIALRDYYAGIKDLPAVKNNVYVPPVLSTITGEDTLIDYTYDDTTKVVRVVRTSTLKPQGAIAISEFIEAIAKNDFTLDPTKPVPYELNSLRYNEIRPGEWERIESKQQVFGNSSAFTPKSNVPRDERIAYKLILGNSSILQEVSRSGQTQPPAAERRPSPIAKEDKEPEQIKSTLRSAQAPQDTKRSEPLEVKFATSSSQLKPLAERENKLIFGRRMGQRFQVPVIDSLIDNGRPNQVWWAIEPDGTKVVYLVDALTYTHDLESSTISAEGIWLGTIAAGETVVQLPYQIVQDFDSGWKWGSTGIAYPYSTTQPDIELNTGWKWGGQLQPRNIANLNNGWKWGGTLANNKVSSSTGWKWGNLFELITGPESIWSHVWDFESPDPLNDKIGLRHFTLQSGGLSSSVTGKFGDGRRIYYDSNNAALTTDRTVDLNFANASFVFAYWFKWEDINAFNHAIGVFDASSSSYYFDSLEFLCWHRQIEGSPFVGWRTDSQSYSIGSFDFFNGVAEGDWIHVICEYNATAEQLTFTVFNATTSDEIIDSNRTCNITAQTSQPFAILTEWDSRFDGIHFAYGTSSLSAGEKAQLRAGEYPFS